MSRQDPYEIFGVWKGCGKRVVQTRYYEMVKDNHPDRYGGNVSGRVKSLSQEIFLTIQKAYSSLNKIEREQTVPPPEQVSNERRAAFKNLERRASTTSSHLRAEKLGVKLSSVSEVMEAETVSTQDAGAVDDRSIDDEDRRAKLAKLARTARVSQLRRPRVPITNPRIESLEEESAISQEQRAEKLARLRDRKRSIPPTVRAPVRTPVQDPVVESSELGEPSSSPSLRGIRPGSVVNQQPASPKDHFNTGYTLFKNQSYAKALEHLELAYEAEPEDGLYGTFYGYSLFLIDAAENKKRAEEILRKAIATQNRQALPDAHLFLGYILKTYDSERRQNEAFRHFSTAASLNPNSHEAAREVRLYQMRQKRSGQEKEKKAEEAGGFFGRFFKK